jgi:hypothetical protein
VWEVVRHDQLIRRQRGLVSLNLKFSWHLVVSRPAEGFVAGRDFASTGSRAIHHHPRNDIVSLESKLCAVVMYRAGLQSA